MTTTNESQNKPFPPSFQMLLEHQFEEAVNCVANLSMSAMTQAVLASMNWLEVDGEDEHDVAEHLISNVLPLIHLTRKLSKIKRVLCFEREPTKDVIGYDINLHQYDGTMCISLYDVVKKSCVTITDTRVGDLKNIDIKFSITSEDGTPEKVYCTVDKFYEDQKVLDM